MGEGVSELRSLLYKAARITLLDRKSSELLDSAEFEQLWQTLNDHVSHSEDVAEETVRTTAAANARSLGSCSSGLPHIVCRAGTRKYLQN